MTSEVTARSSESAEPTRPGESVGAVAPNRQSPPPRHMPGNGITRRGSRRGWRGDMVGHDTAVFMASSGGTGAYADASAEIIIARVDGDPGTVTDEDALLDGVIEGHLGWREHA